MAIIEQVATDAVGDVLGVRRVGRRELVQTVPIDEHRLACDGILEEKVTRFEHSHVLFGDDVDLHSVGPAVWGTHGCTIRR